MIPILALIAGVALGVYFAKRRRRQVLEMAQYGASHGIALALLAMLVSATFLAAQF